MRFLLLSCVFAAVLYGQNYAGTWVMTLGPRVFMVVNLKADGAGYAGSISRPGQFTTGDGVRFSRFGTAAITEPITAASSVNGRLHVVAQDPDDTFDMTLKGPDEALVKWAMMPFEPWKFTRSRAPEPPRVATDWDAKLFYSTEDQLVTASSAEMRKIFDEDQKPRQDPAKISPEQWATIDKQDAERRTQTRALLAAGQLHTGEDFTWAAFIFQHGSIPEDYLLAHTLATIAVAKGEAAALWIAAATLDRYLQSIGKPQIYGTQFKTPAGQPVTQEPYNRELVSDPLRRLLLVPSLEGQKDQLRDWQQQYDAAGKNK
jgi:hypothetical protein